MIKLLSSEELSLRWHELQPLVEKAMVHGSGTVTPHGLFLQCMGAVAQCWVRDGGVCITRYEEIEGKLQLAIVACTDANWFNEGPEILEMFEDFARESQCSKVVVYGRRGWKRVLEKHGYSEPYCVVSKEIV